MQRTDEPVKTAATKSPPSSASPGADVREAATALHVDGMTCGGCAWQIGDALKKLDGVMDATVSLTEACAAVRYDANRITSSRLVSELERIGYEVRDEGSGGIAMSADGTLTCVSSERRR